MKEVSIGTPRERSELAGVLRQLADALDAPNDIPVDWESIEDTAKAILAFMDRREAPAAIRAIVQEWLDKQEHDRCWYYPELFQRLAQELNLKPSVLPCLPAREEFEEGCRRYQAEQYQG